MLKITEYVHCEEPIRHQSWWIGSKLQPLSAFTRVVTFQADGDELQLILDAMKPKLILPIEAKIHIEDRAEDKNSHIIASTVSPAGFVDCSCGISFRVGFIHFIAD